MSILALYILFFFIIFLGMPVVFLIIRVMNELFNFLIKDYLVDVENFF